MKKWVVSHTLKDTSEKFKVEDLRNILLDNRGFTTKEEKEDFLQPKLEDVTIEKVGIDRNQLKKAVKRIDKAIKRSEQIIVFGDYDVDGICGAAVLWETLHAKGAKVMPYIPHRADEGYGLSRKGTDNVLEQFPKTKLIITVDNGIVANAAVDFANQKKIDVIITDHHVLSKTPPKAFAIVHTTMLCGTGVAWMLAKELNVDVEDKNHLELVALATIADLVPLIGPNRTLTKFGLGLLSNTKRIGHLELFKEAALDASNVGVYEVGHIIAPRLNAMGRLEYAMDSLRLLCTKDPKKAAELARKLGETNRERQQLTEEAAFHAKSVVEKKKSLDKVLFVAYDYPQGVVGLVAGKLVETFYRPAVVVSIGEKYSKASARSVSGFNIIEFIRSAKDLLVEAGGHPMAAGFTVETKKLEELKDYFQKRADEELTDQMLKRKLASDCEIPWSCIGQRLYDVIKEFEPFGMRNLEPTFLSKGVTIEDMRLVGKDKRHISMYLHADGGSKLRAIAFGMGEKASELNIGHKIDVVYTIDQDNWQGKKRLQLKIKDIH